LLLDSKPKHDSTTTAKESIPLGRSTTWYTLFGFLLANVVQLVLVLWLRRSDIHRYNVDDEDHSGYKTLRFSISAAECNDEDNDAGITSPLIDHHSMARRNSLVCRRGSTISHHHRSFSALVNRESSEGKRGRYFFIAYISCVVLVWVIFALTVVDKFSEKA
jgi:hypothetical protein